MKSLYDFIVEPVGDKYSNTVNVGDKKLVVNTKIENWKFVNRLARVVETPAAFSTPIKKEPCLLYTSPSPRDRTRSRMPSSA